MITALVTLSDSSSLRELSAMSLKLYGMIGFDDRPKPI